LQKVDRQVRRLADPVTDPFEVADGLLHDHDVAKIPGGRSVPVVEAAV